MLYANKKFHLCRIPLKAKGPQDVKILRRSEHIEEFPELFKEFEEHRSHAFTEDGLFSIVRAEELFNIVRTDTDESAREMAFEDARANLITNLQHKVMQEKDAEAVKILRKIHDVDTAVES
jgi:tRNA/tmRNA/rRNA uracil-C5-methylase (TrmA/RlmC/RlmD family)